MSGALQAKVTSKEVLSHFQSESGTTLVMTLVSLGMVSLISLGVGSVISSANKEQKRLVQKLELIDLKNSVIGAMANPANCTCQLSGRTFAKTATGYSDVVLNDLKAACLTSSVVLAKSKAKLPGTQTGLKVAQIRITDIQDRGNPGEVAGYFTFDIDDSTSVGTLQSVKVLQSFKLDSSQNLLSCTYDSMTAKTCNKGEMFFGVDAAGTPICRQFPKCAGGSILQGMDSDGNPICVDGRGIANLPAPTVIYQPVAAASSPTPSVYDSKTATTPTVTVATTAAPPVEKKGFTLEISSGNCGTSGDKNMDVQCTSACQAAGARSGNNLKGQCEKDPSAPKGMRGVYTCSCVY